MIVVATWPLFLSLEARLGNRRGPAVAIMTLAMLLLLVLPLWLAIDTIFEHSGQLTVAFQSLAANGLPAPPAWVKTGLPLVGERLATAWAQLDAAGTSGIVAKVTPYCGRCR
jgi:predicted PurR-regulated permease PerM